MPGPEPGGDARMVLRAPGLDRRAGRAAYRGRSRDGGARVDRWLFIHVMKTAGTSFRAMLEASLGPELYPSRDELAALPNRFYPDAPVLLGQLADGRLDLSGRRVLCGHYAARLAGHLDGEWRGAIFLRDPVRRTLSRIAQTHKMRSRLNRFTKPSVARYLDDADFVAKQLRDYQTKVLAMPGDGMVNTAHPIDDAAFARACATLDAMDFVGLTERFADSVALFERLSGIALGPVAHANRSRGTAPSAADIARIEAIVPRDMEIYARARAKLEAALRAA